MSHPHPFFSEKHCIPALSMPDDCVHPATPFSSGHGPAMKS
jgi:hypothetical protein